MWYFCIQSQNRKVEDMFSLGLAQHFLGQMALDYVKKLRVDFIRWYRNLPLIFPTI